MGSVAIAAAMLAVVAGGAGAGAGCGKRHGERGGSGAGAPAAAGGATEGDAAGGTGGGTKGLAGSPGVAAGPLTAEALARGRAGVVPHRPWAGAWAHLLATVGRPTRVGGAHYGWYVAVGPVCHVLEVERSAKGDEVDSVTYGSYGPDVPSFQARCPELAGGGTGAGGDAGPR